MLLLIIIRVLFILTFTFSDDDNPEYYGLKASPMNPP